MPPINALERTKCEYDGLDDDNDIDDDRKSAAIAIFAFQGVRVLFTFKFD